jgi:hypothetical protein
MTLRHSELTPAILLAALLLLGGYVASYFVLVQHGGFVGNAQYGVYSAHYRWIGSRGDAVFSPAHRWDRQMRPDFWSWGTPETFEFKLTREAAA